MSIRLDLSTKLRIYSVSVRFFPNLSWKGERRNINKSQKKLAIESYEGHKKQNFQYSTSSSYSPLYGWTILTPTDRIRALVGADAAAAAYFCCSMQLKSAMEHILTSCTTHALTHQRRQMPSGNNIVKRFYWQNGKITT